MRSRPWRNVILLIGTVLLVSVAFGDYEEGVPDGGSQGSRENAIPASQRRPPPRPRLPIDCSGTPDLVLVAVAEPTWDTERRAALIEAEVRNLGGVAVESYVKVRFLASNGRSFYVYIPPLKPGEVAIASFQFRYWIFYPDADFQVTVDPENKILECREDNNTKEFVRLG